MIANDSSQKKKPFLQPKIVVKNLNSTIKDEIDEMNETSQSKSSKSFIDSSKDGRQDKIFQNSQVTLSDKDSRREKRSSKPESGRVAKDDAIQITSDLFTLKNPVVTSIPSLEPIGFMAPGGD